jgi:hypothetical protein
MKRQTQVVCAIIVIITFGAASFASPFWTVRQLRAAAAAGDTTALEQYVDFPALRESVKAELQSTVIAPMVANSKLKDSPLAGLGVTMATAMLGPVVDSMVSPAGIAKMVQGHPQTTDPSLPDASEPASPAPQSAAPPASPPAPPLASTPPVEQQAAVHPVSHYDGPSRFVVTYDVGGSTAKSAQLILRRDGPFSWKLAGVKLPPLH